MAPPDIVEEEKEHFPAFPSLLQRERPLVLRKAARHWGGHHLLEDPNATELKTTWRLHRLCPRTVWEADCRFFEASVGQFLQWDSGRLPQDADNPFAQYDRKTHWAYADYKHVKELAGGWKEILEPLVNWSALGCDKGAADSTVWLGSEGSHTPLHHDTYGVNMVAQVRGMKKWLLYPPADTDSLYSTRVPYEESSVFSRVDPRAPDLIRFPRFAKARPLTVILEPGDVLYVPKHWWHFVQALDTSLSINVWLDTPADAQDRVKEALARVLVTSLATGLDTEIGSDWLNPTEDAVWPLEETIDVARLAFQGLEDDLEGRTSTAEHESKGTRADSPFTVRAMVDAVTSPDILGLVMKHILDGRTRDGSKGDSQVPPR